MERWYNFETRFLSLRDELRKYLHENGIYYELSSSYYACHFEIRATDEEAAAINKWLDEHSITEE